VSNPFLRPGEHWDPYSRAWKPNLTEAQAQAMWPYSLKPSTTIKEAPKVEPIRDWLDDALHQVAPKPREGELYAVPDRSGPMPAMVDMELPLSSTQLPKRPPTLEEAKTVLLNVMSSADEAKKSGDAVVLPHHYNRFKLEPIRFICENNLNFFQGNIIKYVLRHDAKNGLEDLKKARRYLDMFIRFVEGDEKWSE